MKQEAKMPNNPKTEGAEPGREVWISSRMSKEIPPGRAIANFRANYHRRIFAKVLRVDRKGIPNNADSGSALSVRLARGIVDRIGLAAKTDKVKMSGQSAGKGFEEETAAFVEAGFSRLSALRPGAWKFRRGGEIDQFDQYAHLADVAKAMRENAVLLAALGDYIVKPDIVVARVPEEDAAINAGEKIPLVKGDAAANHTPLRRRNSPRMILHASVSCKWTIRSDRSQNARTEGLNLIRNRKGKTPHIVIVTGEPMPARLASLALGTGDIDCVYHFALHELQEAAQQESDGGEMLDILVSGRRLRDISDLPFDLAI